ncbi:MAG: DedA family protein [Pontimonas sp.]|jgi:membrane-associated protein|nr:DedA family protein [Pontimonas sp.]|tara:strand:- start:3375 stop:4058 length:684 start_codon:yes stop_codon:yes gene_type:complete
MNEVLDAILSWVEGVPPVWRVLVTGVAVLLETSILVGLVVPGDTIVLVSSTGVTTLASYLFTVLAVVLGALAGESIGFSLGRLFGPRLRSSWLGRQVGEKRWAKADRFVQRRGGIAVFISRFLPVFHSVIPLTAGTTAMRYRSFMIWTIPACTIWAFLYVSIGSGAAGTYRELQTSFSSAGWVFIAIVTVSIVLVAVIKNVLHRFADSQDVVEAVEQQVKNVSEDPR